jgi:hypothetical protein
MSCPNNSRSNSLRNIDEVTYELKVQPGYYMPNLPITRSGFPYIDTRQVRIIPPPALQPSEITDQPAYQMRYSFGCTNCIRNRNVLFSP